MAVFSLTSKQLVVVYLPDDDYYRKSFRHIENFVRQMSEKSSGLDDFLVLYSRSLEKHYQKAPTSSTLPFGDKTFRLVVEEPLDLWIRDYGPVLPKKQVKFCYQPRYLRNKDAKYFDKGFTKFLGRLDTFVERSDIVLDGGNVVDNNKNKVIISERILSENKGKSKSALKGDLENLLNSKVAFIPDPEDTTGHSDGIVSFIEDDVLLIGDYDDLEYYNAVEVAVKSEFPDLKTVRLPCKISNGEPSNAKCKGFTSAVGSYINVLVTNNAVYVPQYSNPVYDSQALEIIKDNTDKTVVPIDTSELSHMGGSVRCMSWQIESSHTLAQTLYQHSKLSI